MLSPGLIFLLILTSLFVLKDSKSYSIRDACDESCSLVYEPVCGAVAGREGRTVIKTFHNICHFNKISCWLTNIGTFSIERAADIECGIESENTRTRRIHDFSIVGAHQACNHTCPTFCLDTYDPACAQIWDPNMQTFENRPMINHCHIDLYSCVMGVKTIGKTFRQMKITVAIPFFLDHVTISPLMGKCYTNPSALNFMLNVASLKSLNLLSYPDKGKTRRSSSDNRIEIEQFTDLLQMLL